MRRQFVTSIILAYFLASSGLNVSAEDNIEFFRQFLEDSSSLQARTSSVSQKWLDEIAQSASAEASVQAGPSLRPPVLVAARPERPQPVRSVLKTVQNDKDGGNAIAVPVAVTDQERKPAEVETPTSAAKPDGAPVVEKEQADGLSELPKLSPPVMSVTPGFASAATAKSPTEPSAVAPKTLPVHSEPLPPLTERDLAETPKVENSVQQRVDNLQSQLQAEEKRLESRLAVFAQQRDAALGRQDEKALAQIEKAEKRAVSDYEQRVQRLLSKSLPPAARSVPVPDEAATDPKPQRRILRVPTPRTMSAGLTPQQSAAAEQPTKQKRSLSDLRPSWPNQPQVPTPYPPATDPRLRFAPRTASPNPQPTPATQPRRSYLSSPKQAPNQQPKYRLVSPEQLRRPRASQKPQSPPKPSQPSRKLLKLWPFR